MVDGAQSGELEVLQQLRQKNPDITAAVIATEDGFAVHSDAGTGVDADTLAAMAADICLRAGNMASDLNQGSLSEILVASDGGYVIAAGVSDEMCLAVAAKAEASLGLLIINVRKGVAALAEMA